MFQKKPVTQVKEEARNGAMPFTLGLDGMMPPAGPLTTINAQVPAQANSCDDGSGPDFSHVRTKADAAQALRDQGLQPAENDSEIELSELGLFGKALRFVNEVSFADLKAALDFSDLFEPKIETATVARERFTELPRTDQGRGWLTGVKPVAFSAIALALVIVVGFEGYSHWHVTAPVPAPFAVAHDTTTVAVAPLQQHRPKLVGVLRRAERADLALNPRQDSRGRGQITQIPQRFYALDTVTPYDFMFTVPPTIKWRVGTQGNNTFADGSTIGDVYSTTDAEFATKNFKVWTSWEDFQSKAKIGDVFSTTGQEIAQKDLHKGMVRGIKDVPLYRLSSIEGKTRTYEIQPLRKCSLTDKLGAQKSRADDLRDDQHYVYTTLMDSIGPRGLRLSYPDVNGQWSDADPVDWEVVGSQDLQHQREQWRLNQAPKPGTAP